MNSRPTKKKVLWSIFLAFLINVAVPLINWFITKITWPLIRKYLETTSTQGIPEPANINVLINYLISTTNIILFFTEIVIIYFLWSIFQRKRMPKAPVKK